MFHYRSAHHQVKMATFFVKENVEHATVIQQYTDSSVKLAMLSKKSKKALLGKAVPTSEDEAIYLFNTVFEIELEHLRQVVNQLSNLEINEEQIFINVLEFLNWKKEPERLVMRTSEYGGIDILYQKGVKTLPKHDMVFDDDEACISTNYVPLLQQAKAKPLTNWEDKFGRFTIRKADDLKMMTTELRAFCHSVSPPVENTKRKRVAKKETSRKRIRPLEEDTDDIEETVNECEYVDINQHALVELLYFCHMSKMNVHDCILQYHETINDNLNEDERVDFINIIRNGDHVKLDVLAATFF